MKSHEEGLCRSPNIPDELMFAILVRLPIMCLLRLKCVSKYWFKLISSPDFIKLYLQNACGDFNYSQHKLLYMGRRDGNSSEPTFRYAPLHPTLCNPKLHAELQTDMSYPMKFLPGESLEFVGSCNGLVCITDLKHKVIVWNPTIRKFKLLPNFGRRSLIFYGFGYDESSGDYNVVGICNNYGAKRFSTRTNYWKKLQDFEVNGVDSHGCFLNGKLHWATKTNILTIDLSSELASVMEPPDCVQECCDWKIHVVGEHVVIFCYYRKILDMWMMMRYGVKESWIKVNKRPMDYFIDPGRCLEYIPCFVSKEGELLLHRLYHPRAKPGKPTYRRIPSGGSSMSITRGGMAALLLYHINRDFYSYNSPRRHYGDMIRLVPWPVIVYVESLIWPFP